MDQNLIVLIAVIGIIIVLSILNSILSIVSKINVRNLFILILIVAGGVIFFKYQSGELGNFESSDTLSGAVIEQIEKAVPEYIDSGESCEEVERKQQLGEKYKDELCKEICGEQKNIGSKCVKERFYCKCW